MDAVVTDETVPKKIIGFLPVIPCPITEYNTVYTALKNVQGILEHLKQNIMANTCDEGVYHNCKGDHVVESKGI